MDSIATSISLASLDKVSHHSVIDHHEETRIGGTVPGLDANQDRVGADRHRKTVRWQPAEGGAQQVAVHRPDVLILDEPTRGIDVGAKHEIYVLINELAARGKAVLVISSELPELLGLCDRIYTLSQGRLTGEVPRADATQETLMHHMMKGSA